MSIRMQPEDIQVSPDCPFANDLLGRGELVEALTNIVGANVGPGVLAVDSAWGTGKTTFLKMLAAYMRLQGFSVVEFNAWETDFADNPFLALSAEIIGGLTGVKNAKLRKVVNKILQQAPWAVPRLVLASIPQVGGQLVQEVNSAAKALKDPTYHYRETKKLFEDFRKALQHSAKAMSKDGKPLVVVIDELDRCRPSYAVELLEVAKHFFSVNHVVFVLGVNKSELVHSIQALYGDKFDALVYLSRFIDADYHLPEADGTEFIKALLKASGIDDRLGRAKRAFANGSDYAFRGAIPVLYNSSDLDLRSIAQAIHRLGMAVASLSEDQLRYALTMVVLSLLRSLEPEVYRAYIDDQATDEAAVNALFGRPGTSEVRYTGLGQHAEALLLVARLGPNWRPSDPIGSNNPLLARYKNLSSTAVTDDEMRDRVQHAKVMLDTINRLLAPIPDSRGRVAFGVGFKEVVARLELLEYPTSAADD